MPPGLAALIASVSSSGGAGRRRGAVAVAVVASLLPALAIGHAGAQTMLPSAAASDPRGANGSTAAADAGADTEQDAGQAADDAAAATRPPPKIESPASVTAPAAVKTPAAATPPAPVAAPARKPELELGVSTLRELGFGLQARGRLGDRLSWLGGDLAAGIYPWFTIPTPGTLCARAAVGLSGQVSASLLLFLHDGRYVSQGVRLGGIANNDLGGGGMVGYQAEAKLTPRLALAFGTGFQFFPDAGSFLDRQAGASATCVINHDTSRKIFSTVQYYLGTSLLVRLF